jgi:hypothetical protein
MRLRLRSLDVGVFEPAPGHSVMQHRQIADLECEEQHTERDGATTIIREASTDKN